MNLLCAHSTPEYLERREEEEKEKEKDALRLFAFFLFPEQLTNRKRHMFPLWVREFHCM